MFKYKKYIELCLILFDNNVKNKKNYYYFIYNNNISFELYIGGKLIIK